MAVACLLASVLCDEKEGRHEIWSYFICDLLTGKHVLYHPLINFLQHNVVVRIVVIEFWHGFIDYNYLCLNHHYCNW